MKRFSSHSKHTIKKKGLSKLLSRNSYSSINYDGEDEVIDQSVLKKLGLLKDEDFMKLHKALFVDMD